MPWSSRGGMRNEDILKTFKTWSHSSTDRKGEEKGVRVCVRDGKRRRKREKGCENESKRAGDKEGY